MPDSTPSSITKIDKEWFKENAKLGLENISREDLPIPRLLLVQKTSTKTVLRDGNMAKSGTFYYAGTKESTENFACALLKAELIDLPTFQDRNVTEKVWSFLGAREGDWKPFVFNCRSTSSSAAGGFVSSVMTQGIPMFSLKVVLESRYIESKKGNFYVIAFTDQGVRRETNELMTLRELAVKYGVSHKFIQGEGSEEVEELEPEPIGNSTEEVLPSEIPF